MSPWRAGPARRDTVTSQVDSTPPLPLPPPLAWAPPASRRRWRALAPRRRWGAWLGAARRGSSRSRLAVSLVAVGETQAVAAGTGRRAGWCRRSASNYSLTLSQPVEQRPVPVGLELRSTLTGKTLCPRPAARGLGFAGSPARQQPHVRRRAPQSLRCVQLGRAVRTWCSVTVASTSSHARSTMTSFGSAQPVGTKLLAIALSPDGAKLGGRDGTWTTDTTEMRTGLTVYIGQAAVLRGPGQRHPASPSWAIIGKMSKGGADPRHGNGLGGRLRARLRRRRRTRPATPSGSGRIGATATCSAGAANHVGPHHVRRIEPEEPVRLRSGCVNVLVTGDGT